MSEKQKNMKKQNHWPTQHSKQPEAKNIELICGTIKAHMRKSFDLARTVL